MKKFIYTAAIVAAAFIAGPSRADLVKGQAGEYFPYGKIYNFESIDFKSDREGVALRLPLPKKVVAYIIVPPGNDQLGYKVTPYLSMPTSPDEPALPDDLGYGFELQGTGLNARGGFRGFVVFDLDNGKTVDEINKLPKLRQYCSPDQPTFNPHMCALKTGTPVTQHTSEKYGVVSPLRSEGHTHLLSLLPTVPTGFDPLLVAEVNTFGAFIPVMLDKKITNTLLDATANESRDGSHLSGIPFPEAIARAVAVGRKDKVDKLRGDLGPRTWGEWVKALQLFPDDADLARGFREKVLGEGASWGRPDITSAVATLLRLEQAGRKEARGLREELVRKTWNDYKAYNEGFKDFTHSSEVRQFDTLDALQAAMKGMDDPVTAEIGKYTADHVAALAVTPDEVDSDWVFLRGAWLAEQISSPAAKDLRRHAFNRVSYLANSALSSGAPLRMQRALSLLKGSGIDATPRHAKIVDELSALLKKTVLEQLKAAEAEMRRGGVDEKVLDKMSGALVAGYSAGIDPQDMPVFNLDPKKEEEDRNIRVRRGGNGGGSGNSGSGADNAAGGNKDGDGRNGGREGEASQGGDDGAGGWGDDKSMPCTDFEVDRKNLHNFADQTHWMEILERLKAAGFRMKCSDDRAPPPKDKDDDAAPQDDPPPPPPNEDDECDKARNLPDAEKRTGIDNLLDVAKTTLKEAEEGIEQLEETRKGARAEIDEIRQGVADKKRELQESPGDAALAEDIRNTEQALENAEGKMTLFDRSRAWLDEHRKKCEDHVKEVEDLAKNKDKDLDKAVCEAVRLGRRGVELSTEENIIQPELYELPADLK